MGALDMKTKLTFGEADCGQHWCDVPTTPLATERLPALPFAECCLNYKAPKPKYCKVTCSSRGRVTLALTPYFVCKTYDELKEIVAFFSRHLGLTNLICDSNGLRSVS